jgi:acetyl-CoA/propionyl-CoA carboxylase biotin carboxyl carrier protein
VDSGLEQGWQVPGDYDPMLAKVLAVGPDRASVLARARRALAEFETGGVQTTLPFHAWLLDHPEFTEGRLRTDMVARDWDPEPLRAAAAERAADAVVRHVAALAAGPVREDEPVDPCAEPAPGWRPEPWA